MSPNTKAPSCEQLLAALPKETTWEGTLDSQTDPFGNKQVETDLSVLWAAPTKAAVELVCGYKVGADYHPHTKVAFDLNSEEVPKPLVKDVSSFLASAYEQAAQTLNSETSQEEGNSQSQMKIPRTHFTELESLSTAYKLHRQLETEVASYYIENPFPVIDLFEMDVIQEETKNFLISAKRLFLLIPDVKVTVHMNDTKILRITGKRYVLDPLTQIPGSILKPETEVKVAARNPTTNPAPKATSVFGKTGKFLNPCKSETTYIQKKKAQ